MTTIRSLNENGDWTFGKGRADYKNQANGLKQHIISRLKEWRTDCFFAQNNGVDWNNRLGYKNQEELLEDEIRDMLLKTDEVLEVINVNANIKQRQATVTAIIKTIYSNSETIVIEN
jgi:hypothetical protein